MIRPMFFAFALSLAPAALAQDSPPAAGSANDFDLGREKVLDCEGEKFVFAWGAGAHPTKVTLCSEKGASRDELIRMIESAEAKIQSATAISEERRTAIIGQMNAKIAQLRGEDAKPEPLPPVAGEPAPMPAPKPVAALPAQPQPASTLPAKPRLSVECDTPGEVGCSALTRKTTMIVSAREPVAAGLELRFVRKGEIRAAVPLSPLRKGQSVRFRLPPEVCSGVLSGEADIRVLRSGRELDRLGPYRLRC